MAEDLYIVFDGPPSHESGRFVEVEIACGKSVRAGKWEEYPGKPGLWRLGPFTVPTPSPSAAHAALLAEAEAHEARLAYIDRGSTHWDGCEAHHPRCATRALLRRLAAALRAASPSPVSCEHCGLPWGDGTAHATTAWACDPPAASPSSGAVEAAFREGWRNAYENTDPELGGHGCDEYWLASAARRGAAGGTA